MMNQKVRNSLDTLLDLGEEQGCEVFSLDELLGYLRGLAITPEMIVPGEWLPQIFGGELPEFASEEQANSLFRPLFRVLNSFIDDFHQGKPAFPYDLAGEDWSPTAVEDWNHGFFQALMLRPDLWLPEEGLPLSTSEEEQEHAASFSVVAAIAEPEKAETLFEKAPAPDGQDEEDLWPTLFALLPKAVQNLQLHAARLEQERQDRLRGIGKAGRPSRAAKVGRNAACPCGSGRKHKKCCLGRS